MLITTGESPGAVDLTAALRDAVQLHHAGRFEDAARLYEDVLDLDPNHPDALHLSGVLSFQSGWHVEALEFIDRALMRLPGFADAHNTRGNVLRALGRPDDALGAYRQAIVLAPGSPLAWSNLGNALRDLGRPDEALRAYREAIARAPRLAEAYLNQGVVLQELGQYPEALAAFEIAVGHRPEMASAHARLGAALRAAGRLDEAAESLRRAVALEPDFTSAYCDLGATLLELGLHRDAAEALQAALALDPESPEAHNCLGRVCQAMGYLDQALSAYRQALAGRPDYPEAHYNLGVLLHDLHRPVEAVASFRAALTFRADYADAHASMGAALLRLGRAGEAITVFRRALELTPGAAATWYLLGRAFMEEGRRQDAVSAFDRALTIQPGLAEAHWYRGITLLASGELAAGFAEYEWRYRVPELRLEERRLPAPGWEGGGLRGRTILVHADPGLAEVMLFARFLPLLAARGGRVILECDAGLARLLEAMPSLAQVVSRGDPLPPFDCQLSLQSLPHVLASNPFTIPNEVPYLPVQTWSGKIPVLPPGEGLRVGLAWGGGSEEHPAGALTLRTLMPLLDLPGITWYSLGEGPEKPDDEKVPEANSLQDLVPLIHNLTDRAAMAGQLDLIISTDGPSAHLAGGLGLDCWVLVPANPTWYWVSADEECSWYPTARIFRQPRAGDWTSVVEEIRRALAALMIAKP